jgi:hypothetical protein
VAKNRPGSFVCLGRVRPRRYRVELFEDLAQSFRQREAIDRIAEVHGFEVVHFFFLFYSIK